MILKSGIANTEWEVSSHLWVPGEPYPVGWVWIDARFRDRHGLKWHLRQPISREVAEDIPVAVLFELLWTQFKTYLDRRFDDPYAFWPGLYEGRWAA